VSSNYSKHRRALSLDGQRLSVSFRESTLKDDGHLSLADWDRTVLSGDEVTKDTSPTDDATPLVAGERVRELLRHRRGQSSDGPARVRSAYARASRPAFMTCS